MLKSLLALVVVFMAFPAMADVPTEEELNISHYKETGEFRTSGDYDGSPSGSLYEAVKPGNTSSDETKCIAAGADGCGGGSGGGSGSSSSGGSATPAQAAAAQGAATAAAVKDYVNLHKMNGFDLGRLNSDREATLVISNSNAENNLVFRIIRLIGMLVGTVAILLYIVAGYFMIFSMGDENSLTKGKQIVTYTSLGLIIAFTAYMIVQLVMGLMYFAG